MISDRPQPDGSRRVDVRLSDGLLTVIINSDGLASGRMASRASDPGCETCADKAAKRAAQAAQAKAANHPAPHPRHLTPWEMISGAFNLLKSEMGVDAIDDATYAARRRACEGDQSAGIPRCENYDFGVCGGATGCACYLAAKIRLRGQKCPLNKWPLQ